MAKYEIMNRHGHIIDTFASKDGWTDAGAIGVMEAWADNGIGTYTLFKNGVFVASAKPEVF